METVKKKGLFSELAVNPVLRLVFATASSWFDESRACTASSSTLGALRVTAILKKFCCKRRICTLHADRACHGLRNRIQGSRSTRAFGSAGTGIPLRTQHSYASFSVRCVHTNTASSSIGRLQPCIFSLQIRCRSFCKFCRCGLTSRCLPPGAFYEAGFSKVWRDSSCSAYLGDDSPKRCSIRVLDHTESLVDRCEP